MITSTKKHRVSVSPEIEEINARRLFVFAESRSGSTWLINTLNSHPDISILDEILNPDFIKNFNATRNLNTDSNFKGSFKFIESYIGQLSGKFQGCKILFPQAIRFFDFYEFLLNYRKACFIILYRKNSIKAEISGLIANEYSRWHLTIPKEKQQISVDPEFLYERLLWRKNTNDFCINMLNAYCDNVLMIEYENLFGNVSDSMNKTGSFLNVQPDGFSLSSEIKSNPFLLSELIENYDEVLSFFSDKPEYLVHFSE
jgi:hypothetical protein